MDVVYVIGGKKDERIFRHSLRSMCANCRNIGRVVVVGVPPDWLSDDVVKIPCANVVPPGGPKQANMLGCILAAIDAGAVTGEFLYSSDDHFYGGPFDFDDFPFFIRQPGELLTYAEATLRNGGTPSMYNAMLDCTRRCLLANGLGIDLWCCHANSHMDAQDAPAVRALVDSLSQYDRENFSIEPLAAFMAVRHQRAPVQKTRLEDVKLTGWDPQRMTGLWSCHEWEFLDNALQHHIGTAFGPCRYEKQPKTFSLSNSVHTPRRRVKA